MSRVVTSADIDALSRIIRQQGIDLQRTNERLSRVEAQIAALQTGTSAFAGLNAAGTPVGAQSSPPAYASEVNAQPYGVGLRANVLTQEALRDIAADAQQRANEAEKAAFPNDPLIDLTEPGQPADPYAKVAEKVFGGTLAENAVQSGSPLEEYERTLEAAADEAEAGPDAEDGPEFEGFAERAGSPAETFLSDGGPVTDSAPAADAGVAVAGE